MTCVLITSSFHIRSAFFVWTAEKNKKSFFEKLVSSFGSKLLLRRYLMLWRIHISAYQDKRCSSDRPLLLVGILTCLVNVTVNSDFVSTHFALYDDNYDTIALDCLNFKRYTLIKSGLSTVTLEKCRSPTRTYRAFETISARLFVHLYSDNGSELFKID